MSIWDGPTGGSASGFRSVLQDVNALYRWHGRGWEHWSTLWQSYERTREVPITLQRQIEDQGLTLVAGARFRFDGDEWELLAHDEPDRLER